MKKYYKIFSLFIILILLSTYSPNEDGSNFKESNKFFKIQKIEVNSTSLISENNVKKKLNKIYDKNIFFVKKSDIEKHLNTINFFEKVEIKKKYPETLIVNIFETKPMAVLFKNKSKYFIDSSSNLISFEESMNFKELPNVFGDNAEEKFINFLRQLESNNFATSKIKNFYFFQIDRWDLQLMDDKIIKFPFNNVDRAIKKSVELLKRKDFENYKIIDLRIDGKIIVE